MRVFKEPEAHNPFATKPSSTFLLLSAGWQEPSGTDGSTRTPTWTNLLIAFFLLCMSGLFSGLTLGLMSLDMVSLEILRDGGEGEERAYAAKIIPIREKGNLLLCTLLLGNTMVNG